MEDKKNIEYDEISLVDILRILWKYRIFILVFCLIITLVGFIVFYFQGDKGKGDQVLYKIDIKLPYIISYDFYARFKLKIQYDLNTVLLCKNFNIDKIEIISDELKNIKPPYTFKDFPVVSLTLNIFFKSIKTDEQLKKISDYLKDIIFQINVLKTQDLLKDPIIYSNSIILGSYENYQKFNLFLIDLFQNIEYYFNLNNLDINKDYALITKYICELKLDYSYLEKAQKILLDLIKKEYDSISKMVFNPVLVNNNEVSGITTSLIQKLILVFVASFFISIILVFIIDFFKKNWKEIIQ